MQRIALAGGCYVVGPEAGPYETYGAWHEAWIVNRKLGSEALSMLRVRVTRGSTPIRYFPESETAIFVLSGRGTVRIGRHSFPLEKHDGAYVAAGEGFAFQNRIDEPLELVMTICPDGERAAWSEEMPNRFDETHARRVVSAAGQDRQATGDRFYQVLVDERVGCSTITQFIGAIPPSRAPEHYHHYEETIAVLSGRGHMWTGERKAPVGPGSLIYLPRGQKHCLECESGEGMLLAGTFYPSGSPAVRYE
jgi:mannose-6-phosphate isomerase-like protein (cupin superfamily)